MLRLLFALLLAAPAAAQSADSIMELNRNGRWAEAARLAVAALSGSNAAAAGEVAGPARACALAYHLAYATARLGRTDEAAQAVLAFDDYRCAEELADSWIPREMARLRDELGIADARSVAAAPTSDNNADGFWRVADPAEVGVDAEALEDHLDLCRWTGADACLVVRQGVIVQEWVSPRYAEAMPAMSSTKSIAGILAGMLVDDGRLDIERPVCDWIAEWCDGRRARVTVRHLLAMTSGLPRYEDRSVGFAADKNRFVIALEPEHEPGTRWAYSNEGVQLLSPILDAAAGRPIQDYARERLFEPLGMLDSRMKTDSAGHAWTYADIQTTPRDLARFGLLMLNDGVWNGERIVGEEWVRESTTPSQDHFLGYGLLWWLHDDPRGFAAHGHLDTSVHVYPELDLVIVRMQARPVPGESEGAYERRLPEIVRRMTSNP